MAEGVCEEGAGTSFPQANAGEERRGAFEIAALDLLRIGLAVVPLGGADGKKPLVTGFTKWRLPPPASTVGKWISKFPGAGIGVACGPSGVVIVDVDDAALVERAIAACGRTPLVTATPGGGIHLWYRNTIGQRDAALRHRGLAIDVKAAGGFVVVPPSINPIRSKAYTFRLGDWSVLDALPQFDPRSLERLTGTPATSAASEAAARTPDGKVRVGRRNRYLFHHLQRLAPFGSENEAIEEALHYNETQNEEPEEHYAVIRTARSIWRLQSRGRLRVPATAHVRITYEEMDRLAQLSHKDYPVALALFTALRRAHGAGAKEGVPFAVATEAMVRDNVIQGVRDRKRLDRSKVALQRAGLITCVQPAERVGSGLWRPALFVLK